MASGNIEYQIFNQNSVNSNNFFVQDKYKDKSAKKFKSKEKYKDKGEKNEKKEKVIKGNDKTKKKKKGKFARVTWQTYIHKVLNTSTLEGALTSESLSQDAC